MPCHALIQNTDIANIYHIKQIKRVSLKCECKDDDVKECFITPEAKNSPALVCQPIQRTYYRHKPLRGMKGTGKVVKHELFYMCPFYRKKGIASALADNEMTIYRRNNFDEIQLDAAADGVVVWQRLGFEYQRKSDERMLLLAWKRYFMEIYNEGNISNEVKADIISKIRHFHDVKSKHMKQSNGPSFSDWLRGSPKTQMLPMYKRVA
ncbi:hypothetical protein [Hydrogenimonas urashimensis]|uniref:hypothetical protein n=1 Tax=Hydrogenimonas urashimensis TaxID=2740515 RepID=UPI001914E939|nr:hypothetical protein [Hydrogenimonas urashimensis]